MWRSTALFLLLVFCLSCCGCEYSHEITDMAYAVALGLDKSEEGIRVSIQFAKPLAISGGGGESGAPGGEAGGKEEEEDAAKNKNTTVLTTVAGDFYTALSIAENSLSKSINLSHTKLLLFSAELAQDGISDFVRLFMKNSQFSPNTYVALSLCPAEEYMKSVKPSLELNPAKYYTLVFSQNNSDYLPETTLRDLYFDLSAPGREPVLPVANRAEETSNAQKHQAAKGDYQAGYGDSVSENKTEVAGLAVIASGRLSGVLSSSDTVFYHILRGEMKEYYFSFESPSAQKKRITLRLTQDILPKNRLDLSGNQPMILSEVFLTGEIVECPDRDIKERGTDGLEEMAEEKLSRELSEFFARTQKECGADIVGFGKTAKLQFQDIPSWESYHWQERYKTADFSVRTNIRITREGLVHAG